MKFPVLICLLGLALLGALCFGFFDSQQLSAETFDTLPTIEQSAATADEGVSEFVNRQRREIRELHERIKSDPKKVAHLRAHLEFYVDELESKKAQPAVDEQAIWPFRRRCRGRCCDMANMNGSLAYSDTSSFGCSKLA
jgi:hypothetical protein